MSELFLALLTHIFNQIMSQRDWILTIPKIEAINSKAIRICEIKINFDLKLSFTSEIERYQLIGYQILISYFLVLILALHELEQGQANSKIGLKFFGILS